MHAVFGVLITRHQAQVVDHDQAEILDAAQLCLHGGNSQAGCIVNEDVTSRKLSCGSGKVLPICGSQFTCTQAIAVDQCLAGEHTVDKLISRHLQRENANCLFGLLCHVGGNVKSKRSLTHTGTRTNQNKVTLPHSCQNAVKSRKSGLRALRCLFVSIQIMQMRIDVAKHVLDVAEALGVSALCDIEDKVLCVVDDVGH